jgi:Fe(3+) dicitrate transport protein
MLRSIVVRLSRCLAACMLAAVMLPESGRAQAPGRVEGQVLQEGLGEPLAGVNVYVEGQTLGAATAAAGRFVIASVPPGTHTLVASMLGFETARQEVTVRSGETTQVTFRLLERPIEIAEIVVERVMMTGGRSGVDEIPGSATYISPRELARFSYNDVHRVLQRVPGIYVQEEDGYGLRPNIGMRGTGSERSSKITLMEDGVLMAPAPYAAPAAYYFPTVGRMQGVEVRKGSSQIKYGPYTTGGALNLISTQIPSEFAGSLDLQAGEHGTRNLHAYAGHAFENVGFLVETYQAYTDGFKQLDTGGDTGFEKQDYLAKLRLNTDADARVYQALTLKVGRTTELSDETYLGLTELDFDRTPYRRYAGSQEDLMDTEHLQLQARHFIRPAAGVDVTTTLYRTDFDRNWYKLDRVRPSADAASLSIDDVLAEPAANAAAYAILTGQTSPNDNALEVKANNRSYYAQGVQSVVGLQLGAGRVAHDLEVGLRYHEDAMDRFQWVDLYEMEEGTMVLGTRGTPGTESNRIESARALAAYAQYRLARGGLSVMPGLRYEHITLKREDYGKEDPERTGADLQVNENTVDVLIPGVGVEYQFSEAWGTFVGIHKGFSPPGSREGTKPEASVNYEVGGRYRAGGLRAEGVFFFNDYSNLLGADLAASGGQGTTDQFNGGQVDVVGLELSLDYDLARLAGTRLTLPLSLVYTYTDATFKNAFESEFEPWGTVRAGDALPYLPQHQLAAGLGLEGPRFGLHVNASYVGRMRTKAGQGDYVPAETIDAHFVLDVAGDVRVVRQAHLFARLQNVTDAVYAVARRPAGLRPGLPRTFSLGLRTTF